MEVVTFLFGFAAGMLCLVIWGLIIKGHQEGNRLDYVTKIGLLKREQNDLIAQIRHTNELLEASNNDCHRLQKKITHLRIENEQLTKLSNLTEMKV